MSDAISMKPSTRCGLLVALMLAACARDSYTIIPGGPGSQARMAIDAQDCKTEAMQRYFEDCRNPQGVSVCPRVLAPLLGVDRDKMQIKDIKPAVELCMSRKGYQANPDNEP